MSFHVLPALLYYTVSVGSSDEEGKIFVFLLFGLGMGLFLFITGLNKHRILRLIENIPTSTARAMAVGLVEIKGVAVPYLAPLVSPFSQRSCVHYYYKVEELRGSGKHRRWVKVAEEASAERFYVRDETGEVLVSPNGAERKLSIDHKYANTFFGAGMPPIVKAKLEEFGLLRSGFFNLERPLRIEESFIEPNDSIYVMGTAVIERAGAPGSEKETLIVCRGTDEPFFLISDKSEKGLISSLRFWVWGGVLGGAASATICLGFLTKFLRQGGF